MQMSMFAQRGGTYRYSGVEGARTTDCGSAMAPTRSRSRREL